MRVLSIAIVMLLAPAVTFAQGAPVRTAALPTAVRQSIAEMNAICRDASGTPGRSPELIKIADLNGDGMNDYVVDMGSFNCEGAASVMVNGQSGANVTVFVGGPNNTAAKAWTDSVYGNRIDRTGARPRLYVDVAAISCGQRNAANLAFAAWQFCSRPLNWNATKKAFEFAPMAEKRPLPKN
jgi:hypothetical protein